MTKIRITTNPDFITKKQVQLSSLPGDSQNIQIISGSMDGNFICINQMDMGGTEGNIFHLCILFFKYISLPAVSTGNSELFTKKFTLKSQMWNKSDFKNHHETRIIFFKSYIKEAEVKKNQPGDCQRAF